MPPVEPHGWEGVGSRPGRGVRSAQVALTVLQSQFSMGEEITGLPWDWKEGRVLGVEWRMERGVRGWRGCGLSGGLDRR